MKASTEDGWLLTAATQPGPLAAPAWERWRARCRVDTAGKPSQALFPMLYGNLIAELGGPDAALLKGVYRRAWYGNQLALAGVKPLLERLAGQGLVPILLNDAALAAGHYPDLGHRSIRCIDVLVPARDWDRSIASAAEAGWKVLPEVSFASATSLSIMTFTDPEQQSLRLWTNLFTAEPQEDTERRIWQAARSVEVNGRSVAALGPVEQLLCLSAEALRAARPPLFLYADARLLARSLTAEPDWIRLVWQAQRYEHILPLRNMLAFLERRLAVELPTWVLPSLHRMAISHAELIQYSRGCERLPLRVKSACLRCLRPVLARHGRGR